MRCSFCDSNTIIAGTLLFYTSYRCEDKDYIMISDEDGRAKGYFEIMRYCPACLLKYCMGKKE